MKHIRKFVLFAVTVLFLGASMIPASAAAPYSANANGWRTYTSYYYPSAYYGYKPAQKPATTKPGTGSQHTTTPAKPPASTGNATNAPAVVSAAEQQMVNLVNQERKNKGLPALTVDSRLVKVARLKSQDMIDKNYFGHQSPTYGSPFDMLKAQGITYQYAAENIAGAQTVQQAHTNLMNSAGHRANILNANYKKIGIGVVQGGPYGLMISQEFTG
ncbi:MAG: CAP domain-containing protein [Bacillota bacterium]